MFRMGLVKSIKETESWKTFVVIVKIRAPNEEMAKNLVTWSFDEKMSFEDKGIHLPLIMDVEEEKWYCTDCQTFIEEADVNKHREHNRSGLIKYRLKKVKEE